MSILTLKFLAATIILLTTIGAGYYPFAKRLKTNKHFDFPVGEALASGVFLGAGLLHMLADSTGEFLQQGLEYPLAFLLAGIMFLSLLWLEHLGRDFYEHEGTQSPTFALLAMVMLSLHSLLAGAALGLSKQLALFFMIFIAILAHKWAASFALAVQINKSSLPIRKGIGYFLIFAVMAPLGIFLGNSIDQNLVNYPLLSPIFTALAAGTFLYLGTLHGLSHAVMVQKCCNLKHYTFVIVGFAIMAIVAIWA